MNSAEGMVGTLRGRGFKITAQRLAIVRFLAGNRSHPTAQDIYQGVSQEYPSMSFATVYNTLAALSEVGLVWQFVLDGGTSHFDPNTHRHHHAYCELCGRVFDIEEGCADLSKVQQLADSCMLGFEVLDCHLIIRGRCRRCPKPAGGAS